MTMLNKKNRGWAACALLVLASAACNTSPQAKEAKYLKRAEAQVAKKEYSRAILELQNAIQAMPKDAEPYYQLGLAYLGTHNVSGAVNALRKATKLNPQHAGAQLKLAQIMTVSRNKDLVQEAAGRLQGVLNASPDNPDAMDTLAMAEFQLGKTEDAAARLQDALGKFPEHLQSAVALARLKLVKNDLTGAEEVLKKAVASAPKSPDAELALSQLYMVLRQPEKAEPEVRRALQLDPQNGSALMGLAAILIAQQRMDEAEQTYKQLSALPDKPYHHLHASFLYRTGKKDAALAEFEKLANSDLEDRAARTRVLSLYVEMNKIADAQNLLAAALKRNPKDTDALLQSSELNAKLGKVTDAEKALKEVLRIKPDSAEAHYVLAGVYKAQGLRKSDEHELNEALRLKPRFLPARLALARKFIMANQAKAALDLLDQAPGPQKSILAVIIERNWAMLQSGNTKEVRAILDQALPAAGRVPELLLQDAVLKMDQKDFAGARADAEEALTRNPADVRAARFVAETYVAQKDVPKAVQRLAEIVAARPKSAPLQNLLGQGYLRTGNLAAARKSFETAKSIDAGFVTADLALAEIDRQENHVDAARQRLAGIVAADSKNVPALLMLANIEAAAGNRAEAIARYRAVLEVDSTNLVSLNNMAFEMAVENPDEAVRLAQHAMEIAPESAAVQDTLGWVYYRKGIYSSAVNYLKTAVEKESTPRRQFHLAMSYLKSGNRDLGQKMLQAALQRDPNLAKTEQGW